jgi:hypothetical protein
MPLWCLSLREKMSHRHPPEGDLQASIRLLLRVLLCLLPLTVRILWRHYLPASFLKWPGGSFPFDSCADYTANDGGCVGAVVSIDGVLQP